METTDNTSTMPHLITVEARPLFVAVVSVQIMQPATIAQMQPQRYDRKDRGTLLLESIKNIGMS